MCSSFPYHDATKTHDWDHSGNRASNQHPRLVQSIQVTLQLHTSREGHENVHKVTQHVRQLERTRRMEMSQCSVYTAHTHASKSYQNHREQVRETERVIIRWNLVCNKRLSLVRRRHETKSRDQRLREVRFSRQLQINKRKHNSLSELSSRNK